MIGILPACGAASRMSGIPKMLLPTPNGILVHLMLQRMLTTVDSVHVGASGPTMDLLRTLYGDMSVVHNFLPTRNMSETLLRLRDYAWGKRIAFGMPDTYIETGDPFTPLSRVLADTDALVAVGVFRARPDQHMEGGMVIVDGDRVTGIVDKAEARVSDWIWGVLAWKPAFWAQVDAEDAHVGYAVQRAIDAGLDVRAVTLDGGFWDCGTPDRYFRLLDHLRG